MNKSEYLVGRDEDGHFYAIPLINRIKILEILNSLEDFDENIMIKEAMDYGKWKTYVQQFCKIGIQKIIEI